MPAIEIHGHRGYRGRYPENTLVGFANTFALGVDAIEFDVALTKDEQIVIVHDRRLSEDIHRTPDGLWLKAPGPVIRHLTLKQLREYDAGRLRPESDYANRFPEQLPADGARIPTLEEFVALQLEMNCGRIDLNIEIKISPLHANETAGPDHFSDHLLAVLSRLDVLEQSTIQSFDWRVPQHVRRTGAPVRTSCLSIELDGVDTIGRNQGDSAWTGGLAIRDTGGSVPQLIAKVGADIWAPWHQDLNESNVLEAHALGQRVITWTVNETVDISRAIELGVDGIISDYPDRVRRIFDDNDLSIPAIPETEIPSRFAQPIHTANSYCRFKQPIHTGRFIRPTLPDK